MQQDAVPPRRPEQPPDSTSSIHRIGIRVPRFWPKKSEVRFAQMEGQCALSDVTQDATQFCYVSLQLDNLETAEVEDITNNRPYDRMKVELIRRLPLNLVLFIPYILFSMFIIR